jgi:hypothetical protein
MGEISEIAQAVVYLDSAKDITGRNSALAEHRPLKPVSPNPRNNKALVFLRGLCFVWCRHQESNPGPTDYKSVALPTELYRRVRATIIAIGLVL